MENKPPLGVSPHWFVYLKRIRELNEAIGRYIEHVESNRHIEYPSQYYMAIAQWAHEIEGLALLEAEICKAERKEQT
jgi:hypothetical protein